MTWIQRLPGTSAPVAAVAVIPDNRGHTGIVYSDEAEESWLLHLAFHHQLQRDLLDGTCGWILSGASIPKERLEHVAAMCARVWQRYEVGGLPYGFRYVASRFNEEGVFVLGADERGLTCATFVLAVYRAVGLELLKLDEWPQREEDQERFEALMRLLARRCSDVLHVEAVRKQTRAIRYRPLEVAGGSGCALPATFSDAVSVATAIEEELVELDHEASIMDSVPPAGSGQREEP